MPDNLSHSPLLLTKLHRPPLPVDLVPRLRLIEWLEPRRGRPLTLVSAPAGYGKSTLISRWLESVDCPSTWLSLDESDNELGVFLSYFLAAIETIFPGAMPDTQALIMATSLPPNSTIAKCLINEIDQLEQPFILVLDDYHLIDNQKIQDLLNELLLRPPHNFHLVLGTRMDPLLPLVSLRARSQVAEIRIQDLRFTPEETVLLFQKMIGVPIDQATLMEIDNEAEGWVTGLRLAALAMRHRIGRDSTQGILSVHNHYVTEYLVTEILAKQASTLSDSMLKTSILERFCVELCETLCFDEPEVSTNESTSSVFNGEQFVAWLRASNLFVIPLDDRNKWFRYHHFFREFLQQELTRRFTPDEITALHAAAGHWYAQKGWIEEALYHLLAANDINASIQLVAQHRYSLMNTTQWPRLERWLNLFSTETVGTSAELSMLKTWLVYHRGQWSELPVLLHQLEIILAQEPDLKRTGRLDGEINSLQSLTSYHTGDVENTIFHARKALELIDPELWIARVFARMHLGGGLLLKGDVNGGYHAFYGAFEEEKVQNKRFKATLLMTICYVHWITADLSSMALAANQSIDLCKETEFLQILGQSNYHLGSVDYQWNNLTAAEELFAYVVNRPYQNYGTCYTTSVCGLALTFQALGKYTEAWDITEEAISFLLEIGNTTQIPIIGALQAELALMQGRLIFASQWAEKLDPVPPFRPMPWFLAPHLTLVKVWLAQNTPHSMGKAGEMLFQLKEYLESIHNTRFLIETLALQALLNNAAGDRTAALVVLGNALKLAKPGGFIRLFVDLGGQMVYLLSQMKVDRELRGYITQILAAFPESHEKVPSTNRDELLQPLTVRELQILELLEERLTNKEIASQLAISPGTVKGHTINIYQKLAVNGRRQAVERAIDLGILSPIQ